MDKELDSYRIFSIVPAMICVAATDGYFKYLNPEWEKVLGYPLEELLSRPVFDFIHPDDHEYTRKEIERQVMGEMTLNFENRYRCKDGSYKVLEWRSAPAEGDRLFAVAKDITDQKQAERKLRLNEDRFRQLFEHMSSGVAVYEAFDDGEDFVFVNFNKAAEKIEQITKDEVIGERVTQVFPGVVDFGLFDVFRRVWRTGVPEHFPVSHYKDERIEGWRENYIYKLPSGEIVAIYDDITAQKQSEEKLKESQKLLYEMTSQVPGVLFQFYSRPNGEMGLYYVSERAEEFTGLKSDLDGFFEQFTELVIPEHREAFLQSIQKATEEISLWHFEGVFQKRTGERVSFSGHSTPSIRENEVVFNGIILDITEQKKTEEEQRKLQDQLIQAQKMESIGSLAGGIAHDFNNILSSILGFTELALDDTDRDSAVEDSLQEVYKAGKRAKELVWQILTFARQTDETTKLVRVDTIAQEVLKFIRSSITTLIEIRQDIISDSLILANPTQIHQVIMNLCTNAAHAMDESGGILAVALTDVTIDQTSTMCKKGLKPGEYIEIKVSDTGSGISPDVIGSIFEPYFTTKALGEGTGMGLAVVKGVVENSGGEIIVESRIGEGTTFRVYLPIEKKHQVRQRVESEDLPSGTERILFIDDEAPLAQMGTQILERLGYSVTMRTSSIEALELFKSKPADFDLVISDMAMPNMTGDILAKELMSVRPDIPVILCTGYSKKISDESATEIGIKAFVYKPLLRADLAKIVRKVIDDAKVKTQQ